MALLEVRSVALRASRAGKFALAAALWGRVVADDAEDVSAALNLALALAECGEPRRAIATYEAALARASERPHVVACLGNLAALHIKLGDPAKACRSCEVALESDERVDSLVAYNYNTALRQLGRTEEAIQRSWTWLPFEKPRFVRQEDEATTDDVTVCCVKWGTKYGPEYVNRLFRGALVCFTDDATGIDSRVDVRALPPSLTGWWAKAFVFSAAADLAGRVLYLDLDTVLTPAFDARLFFSSGKGASSFLSLLSTATLFRNERRLGGFNSSLVAWNASSNELRPVHDLLVQHFAAVTSVVYKFDHWLEMLFSDVDPKVDDLAVVAPPGAVRDYDESDHAWRSAMVVCFPLKPKPHDLLLQTTPEKGVPPIARYWASLDRS